MAKITFLGAGSTIFVKNIIGDCFLTPALRDAHVALYDIDGKRLRESKLLLDRLNTCINKGRATVTAHLGPRARKTALRGADYVVNAVQIGGYEPSTVIDFEVPKKYGLRQTIADTVGIGGIFRSLRTVPVMLDFARDMESACPDAWMLNYSNPMAMLTGAMLRGSAVKTVGLCHSVQGCASGLLERSGLEREVTEIRWKIAGINHMAWLLEITDGDRDLYPEIKRRYRRARQSIMKMGARQLIERGKEQHGEKWRKKDPVARMASDAVRLEIMHTFGYYVTESSEHNAEYMPYWIKSRYPELIERFAIPLDDYPRRCVAQIEGWEQRAKEMVNAKKLTHKRSLEYGSRIMEAMETDVPYRIGGNVLNNGLITNLPSTAVVEVACLVDRNGVQGCHVGELPEQLAALNRTNINVQLLAVEASLTCKRDKIYQAALLDPHTSSELSIDDTIALCDDLIKAHGDYLPKYR